MLANHFSLVTGIWLLCAVGQASLPGGGNKSALPYLLHRGGKDACLNERTLKEKGECLQALLENYYGEYFTVSCPALSLILAERKCKGCPWDRVNASMLSPSLAAELNRSELFHPASASCMIGIHVESYNNYGFIRGNVFSFGILGTLLLFVVTAYYSVSSSSDTMIENGAVIFGLRMPEPAFLLTLWMLYHAGSFLLIVSEDYVEFCEGEADRLFQEAARYTIYAILLMISLKRCRALHMEGFFDDVQSWGRYFASAEHGRRKRFLSILLGPLAVVFFLAELMAERIQLYYLLYDKSICHAGEKNWKYFTIQLVKILLEMFVVTVYACGPPRKRGWFYFRYCMLMMSLLCGCTLFVLVCKGHNGFDITFMMIPRVADTKIALPLTNLAHAICVSAMGLLEPIRIGWPGRFPNQFLPEMK